MEIHNQTQLEQYLTINTVALKLGVSRGTVYNLVNKGIFDVCEITPDITRLKASQVQSYLDRQTKKR